MSEADWLAQTTPQGLLDRIHDTLANHKVEERQFVESAIETLLQIEPKNEGILYLYGTYHMQCKRMGIAEQVLKRALEINPRSVPCWNNLGVILHNLGRHDEAKVAYRNALERRDDGDDLALAEIYNNLGSCYINNGTPDEAIGWFGKAIEIDPQNVDARWNQGLAYLEKGDWVRGWQGYEVGLEMALHSTQHRKRRYDPSLPLWRGESGKDLLVGVYGEQGVGDEILASSMLNEAADRAPLLYEAHPRLVNIMRHNFGNRFPVYGTRKVKYGEDPLHWTTWTRPLTHKCPIFQLGAVFRTRDEDFPRKVYLKPFPDLVEKYRRRVAELGRKPKIGISWKGGNEITRRDLRSIPIEQWIPLLRSADVDWISLQYDPAERNGWNTDIVKAFTAETGIELNHWPDVVNDLDECYAGLIHALDLVISVNNSLVHACGAFGVPCWTLTPSRPAWRYNLEGRHMIWYDDHVIQYRQEGDDWTSVLETVRLDLQGFLKERSAA